MSTPLFSSCPDFVPGAVRRLPPRARNFRTDGLAQQNATVRTYYIAADEVDWSYLPSGIDGMNSSSEIKLWSIGSPSNGTLSFESPLTDVVGRDPYEVLDLELVRARSPEREPNA